MMEDQWTNGRFTIFLIRRNPREHPVRSVLGTIPKITPMKLIYRLLVTAAAGLLTACSSSQICTRDITKSDPAAVALLAASQRAQGKKAFENVRDVSVRYEGKWGSIAPRFQPVLVDKTFGS